MAHSASTHWWYEARRALFAQLLSGRIPPGATALDIGCGTGETLALLRSLGAKRVAGTDLSAHALGHAKAFLEAEAPPPGSTGPTDPTGPTAATAGAALSALAALAEQLPFPDACADVVVSSDVLEHLDNDQVALREYHRVLRDGGSLLVTVPSYRWLWCGLDDRAGHRRRYRLGELAEAVTASGFVIERRSYYFSFLLPAAALLRRTPLRQLTPDTDEDVSGGPFMSGLLGALSGLERGLLSRWALPFGLSQFVLATAKPQPARSQVLEAETDQHHQRQGDHGVHPIMVGGGDDSYQGDQRMQKKDRADTPGV